MGNSVINHYTVQYADMVRITAQQMETRMREYVEVKSLKADEFAYESLSGAEMRAADSRYQKVSFDDITHSRRKIPRRRYVLTLPIDGYDKLGMIIQPDSNYVKAAVMAVQRQFDRIAVNSLFADVQTGKDFGTTVTFANDGGVQIDATSTGLTYAKMLATRKQFTDYEVGINKKERLALGISGDEIEDLLSDTNIISGDYTRQYKVDEGEVQYAVGFNIVKFGGSVPRPILAVDGSSQRSCFATTDSGCCVAINKDMDVKIQERVDLYDTWQVQTVFIAGAVRTEGAHVREVLTTAS